MNKTRQSMFQCEHYVSIAHLHIKQACVRY